MSNAVEENGRITEPVETTEQSAMRIIAEARNARLERFKQLVQAAGTETRCGLVAVAEIRCNQVSTRVEAIVLD